jgi:hypothetical protein
VKVDRAAAGMLGMPAAAADAPGTTAARISRHPGHGDAIPSLIDPGSLAA